MRPIRIDGAEPRPLDAPDDWDEARDGHCGALFVRREQQGDMHIMRSAWEVDPGEAAFLYAGAQLTLGISGNRHPVVQLGVGPLPDDFEPVVQARRITKPSGELWARVDILFAHGAGCRAFAEVPMAGQYASFGAAIAAGVDMCESLARKEGWIK